MKQLFLIAITLLVSVFSSDDAEAQSLQKQIAPFVDEQTVLIGHINLSKLDPETTSKFVDLMISLPPSKIAMLKMTLQSYKTMLESAGVTDIYTLSSIRDWPTKPWCLVANLKQKRDLTLLRTMAQMVPKSKSKLIGNSFVVVQDNIDFAKLKKVKPGLPTGFASALLKSQKSSIQAIVFMPEPMRKSMNEVVGRLPEEWGGAPLTPLTRDFRWMMLSAKLQGKAQLKLELETTTPKAAKQLQKLLGKILTEMVQSKQVLNLLAGIDKLIERVNPKVIKNSIVLELTNKELAQVIQPMAHKIKVAQKRAGAKNRLRQIGLAMHNYYSATNTFPSRATYDKQGRALLSWRVQLLPYLNQVELYNQFKLDEPWDSPNNKKLIAKMPSVFLRPGAKVGTGKTTFLVPVAKGTIFGDKEGCRFRDILDGTSHTILVVDVNDDQATIWTKPADLNVDLNKPGKGLRGRKRGFSALLADGSVIFILKGVSDKILKALFTKKGGEVVGLE